jgi:putative endonuclease
VAEYYVYIMASRSGVLYAGVTRDLQRRVLMHKRKMTPGFTARYNVTRLVHFEQTNDVHAALAREKQIKSWRRSKKTALIEHEKPTWRDLAEVWDQPLLEGD